MDPIDEIKSKIDIVSLISEYVKLSRAGRNFKALCPFHKEKTPSFIVSPELQIWRCFGACGEGGDVFKFLMKIDGLEFGEAVQLLAKRLGIKLTPRFGIPASDKEILYKVNTAAASFYHYLLIRHPIGSSALEYLKNVRGLTDKTIEQFQLGFSPQRADAIVRFLVDKRGYKQEDLVRTGLVVSLEKRFIDRFHGRIVFPLRSARGDTVGFSGRILPTDEGKTLAKYVNTPETPLYHKRQHLFGLDVTREALREVGRAIVVEGEFDLLSVWQAGLPNVVAIKGTAFTEDQARLLSRFVQEGVLALDSDVAGEHATIQGILMAMENGLAIRVASLGAFKDPDEAVRSSLEGFKKKVRNAPLAYDFFIERAFARWNPSEGSGVVAISKELVPIMARISDKIVQAHYVQQVAQRLRVAEEAVATQIDETLKKEKGGRAVVSSQEPSSRPRRELLEEHVVSLALQENPDFLLGAEVAQLLRIPRLLRVREEVQSYLLANKKFDPNLFITRLPQELKDIVAYLLLVDIPARPADSLPSELENIINELALLDLSEKIEQLTQKIKAQEEKGTKVSVEQEELTRLVAAKARLRL